MKITGNGRERGVFFDRGGGGESEKEGAKALREFNFLGLKMLEKEPGEVTSFS